MNESPPGTLEVEVSSREFYDRLYGDRQPLAVLLHGTLSFDQQAKARPNAARVNRILAELRNAGRGELRVLDYGCGWGATLRRLSGRGLRLYGYDLSDRALCSLQRTLRWLGRDFELSEVAEDGSGTVTVEVVLDQEAADRVPDLAEQLRVRDLRRTGWEVTGPEPADGGGVVITATKGFFEPEQMATVLDEIGGNRGPVLDPSLERTRTFGTTAYDFTGTLDLSRGIATFSDRQLTRLLDGFPIGQDQAALEEELGAPLSDLTSFTFEVVLPDGSETQTSTWEAQLGDEPTAMAASTEERNLLAFGLAAGAVLAVLLLVAVLLWRLIRRNKRPVFHRG